MKDSIVTVKWSLEFESLVQVEKLSDSCEVTTTSDTEESDSCEVTITSD